MSGIDFYLQNWARWMRCGCSPAKLPKSSSSMTGLPNYIFDEEKQYEDADIVAAMSTDAAISDLSPIESCAIHHAYLGAVFRFARHDLDTLLASAVAHVQSALIRRGLFVELDNEENQGHPVVPSAKVAP